MRNFFFTFVFLFVALCSLAQSDNFYQRLSDAAIELTKDRVTYDGRYFSIPYPNGDVPPDRGEDYLRGDIVTWDLGRDTPHIGIVTDRRSADGKRPLIVHNIGYGQVLQDCLFAYRITGHYAYKGH